MDGDRTLSNATTEIMRRFNQAFLTHDPSLLPPLVAEDCVIENTVPAPNGQRVVGRPACLELWQGIAANRAAHFELEEVHAAEDRAIVGWRYRWAPEDKNGGDENSVRGVNLMRVRDGLIVEAMGYLKGK